MKEQEEHVGVKGVAHINQGLIFEPGWKVVALSLHIAANYPE